MSNETFKGNIELGPEDQNDTQVEQVISSQEAEPSKSPELDVEKIRTDLEQVERPATTELQESAASESEKALPPPDKNLKAQTLQMTLKETRQKLSPTQRTISKVIHQPQIDAISNLTGKTIARPSGILFGGLFALIGSALYLLASYHYHFAYKYVAFSLFFASGFIIGLLIEFVGKIFGKRKTN